MPKGPRGQKRPGDVIDNVVHLMRIATGEVEDSAKAERRGKAALEKIQTETLPEMTLA